MEPGAGRRTAFDARSRAGIGEIVRRLLAANLRLSAAERLFGAGGRRPDTELLRTAPGEESSAGRQSRARQVSLVPAGLAQTFSCQRMGPRESQEARRPISVHQPRRDHFTREQTPARSADADPRRTI